MAAKYIKFTVTLGAKLRRALEDGDIDEASLKHDLVEVVTDKLDELKEELGDD